MSAGKEPEALVRELAEERVPPEDPALLSARRERMLSAIGRTIRETASEGERRARRRKFGALGLAAAAAAALFIGVSQRSQQPSRVATASVAAAPGRAVAAVQSVTGTLVVTHGGRARVVSRGELPSLSGGDELETAADGEALVKTERTAIQVQPATQVTVLAPSRVEERIRLGLGRIDLKVSKQPDSPRSVVVETPDAEVVVRGTEFTVAVGSEQDATVTRVRVTEGAVWVLHHGERALLGVGDEWASNGEHKSIRASRELSTPEAVPSAAPRSPAHRARVHRAAPIETAAPAVASSSLSEENAMYQAALDARNRGDDRKALELFRALTTRHPSGQFSELAQVERMRALKRIGDNASAAAEARRYLAERGHEFAREEVRGIALGEK